MFKKDTLVLGNCVRDIFILSQAKLLKQCDQKNKTKKFLSFPYGEKIGVEAIYHDLGGEACNAAVAISKIRIGTNLATVVGDDIYSREVLGELKNKKVGFRFITKEKKKDLGISFILLGPDRDRSILAYRTPNDFGKIRIRKLLKKSDSVFMAGINRYSKVLEQDIVEHILKTKKELYINPSSYQIEKRYAVLKRILKNATVVAVNVEEAQKILKTRNRDIKSLLRSLKKTGAELVLITDGKRGAYVYDGKIFLKSGIYPSKRIDTTGAGDSFFATFVAFKQKGYDIEDCLKFASINSASVVSVYGAQKGLLGVKEIFKRYRKDKVRVRKF
jgi:sugar/nucleoside kinase (ribokinase family)